MKHGSGFNLTEGEAEMGKAEGDSVVYWEKYGDGISVLTLQEKVVQKVNGLSENDRQFLLDMIERFMQPGSVEEKTHLTSNRIGIAKGQDLYDDDFDETNPEIEKMFGWIEWNCYWIRI